MATGISGQAVTFKPVEFLVAFVTQILDSVFFFSSRRRHTRCSRDWSSDVCSSDLGINPQMVNEAGFQYSYGAILSKPVGLDASANSPDVKPTLPFPVTLGRIPSVSVSGLSGVAGFGPYNDYNRDYNAFTNQSWARGPHAFKFGLSYHHYQKTENAAGNNVGSFSVTTASQPTTTGATTAERGWANFLLGRVATFSQASVDITPDIRTNQFEMYAQDDYRLRK